MNQDQIQGKWRQVRGMAKERWGRLRNNDLDVIRGRRDRLLGRLQELYGLARREAAREVDRFERHLAKRAAAPKKAGKVIRYRIRIVRRRTARPAGRKP